MRMSKSSFSVIPLSQQASRPVSTGQVRARAQGTTMRRRTRVLRHMRIIGATLAFIASGAVASCGTDPDEKAKPPAQASERPASETPTDATPTSAEPSGQVVRYVAFGDSWPEGAHCGGCDSFAYLWADLIEAETGLEVELTSFMGDAEQSGAESKTSASLLASLKEDATRAAVSTADVILIATGPNALDEVVPKVLSDRCGGRDGLDCISEAGQAWAEDFDAILDEIDLIRADRPALVRLVNAANVFAMDEELAAAVPKGFVSTGGELMFELLTEAQCDAAEAHRAVCVDVRPLITGPDGDGDENSDASMQAVADALIDTGLRELRRRDRG